MGKKKQNNFLMQGMILAAAAILSKVIGLAYRIPLTNILGSEGNGYYGIVFQVYNLALMLTSYSLPTAVSKLVSERLARKEYKNVQRVFKSAMTFGVVAGGVVTLVIFFGAGFICTKILRMELAVYALRILSPCIFIVAVLGVLRGYFQGHNTMIPTAVSQVLEQIVHVIVSIVCAYGMLKVGLGMAQGAESESYGAAFGAAGATVGTVVGAFAALLFLLLIYFGFKPTIRRRMSRQKRRRAESTKYIYKVLILTTVPIILSATLYNITNILDQTVFTNVMAYLGYTEKEYTSLLGPFSGQYDTLMGIPASIASALASSFIPSLVATIQTGTRRQIQERISLVNRVNMIIAIPCAFGFIALARPLLDLLFFTQDNALPAMFLRIGGISVVFLAISTVTNAALQGLDQMSKPVKNAAIALLLHLIALLIMMFVFKLNIYAVVISKVIFAGLICIFNARDLYKACGYRQEIKKSFILPGISALIMSAAALIVYYIFKSFAGNAIATILALIVAVAVYAVSLVISGGITETELLMMPKGTLLLRIFRKLHLMR